MFTFKNGRNSAMNFEKLIPQSSINYDDLNILISVLDKNDKEKIKSVLNMENAAKYSFISSAINNYDGITKNFLICNTKSDNKFRIIPYDLDLTFGQTGESGFVIASEIPKFENGLLERAEDIFFNDYGGKREEYVGMALYYIDYYGNRIGILDSLKNEISQAYKNDPYLQGENLDEYIEKIKSYIRAMREK